MLSFTRYLCVILMKVVFYAAGSELLRLFLFVLGLGYEAVWYFGIGLGVI